MNFQRLSAMVDSTIPVRILAVNDDGEVISEARFATIRIAGFDGEIKRITVSDNELVIKVKA